MQGWGLESVPLNPHSWKAEDMSFLLVGQGEIDVDHTKQKKSSIPGPVFSSDREIR